MTRYITMAFAILSLAGTILADPPIIIVDPDSIEIRDVPAQPTPAPAIPAPVPERAKDELPAPTPVPVPVEQKPVVQNPARAATEPTLAPPANAPATPYWLGLYLDAIPDVAKDQMEIEYGLVISEVVEKSPAASAGVRKNDILSKMDGVEIRQHDDVLRAVAQSKGNPITLQIIRKGKQLSLRATPQTRPEGARGEKPEAEVEGALALRIGPDGKPAIAIPGRIPGAGNPRIEIAPVVPPAEVERLQGIIKELEGVIAQQREAAANQLAEARKAYEEAVASFRASDVESKVKSAIDELSNDLKRRIGEGIKSLKGDEAQSAHRELVEMMNRLEKALREQRNESRPEPARERAVERGRPERAPERPAGAANALEQLKREIESLRGEIDRLKREAK